MTEQQRSDEDSETLTPEEMAAQAALEKKREEAEQHLKELERAGWKWNEQQLKLTHPDDPDLSIWYDPFTAEQFLSPKLAEHVAARIRESESRQPGHEP